ncbi:hypothetical protein B0H14DRAFT_2949540 [Mycena olivaceomarginata]|nr:hypothetical protein B0H14DRAFT_2949540 [Mycena olivaceomarginata]
MSEPSTSSTSAPEQMPPANRPASRTLESLGVVDSDSQVNKYDLLCPRPGCGSIISPHRLSTTQMEPADRTPSLLAPMPEPPRLLTVCPFLSAPNVIWEPVGWSEVGGTEFWLACSRVGYRA